MDSEPSPHLTRAREALRRSGDRLALVESRTPTPVLSIAAPRGGPVSPLVTKPT